MTLGIFSANILNFTNGTTEDGPSVTANDNQLKTYGVNNDGLIQTDGAGSLSGLVAVTLQKLNFNTTAVSASGSTTGTASLYQILQGTIKVAVIVLTNFRNGSAGDVNLALPVPFASHCLFWSGDSGPFDLKSSGTSQTMWTQLGFASAAGNAGSSNSNTNSNSNCNGHCDTAFDTIGLWGSQAGTYGGSILLVGV